MKYFEIMVSANNAVGANFYYVTGLEKEAVLAELDEDEDNNVLNVEEVSETEYHKGKQRQHRKFIRFVTGYPK